MKNAYFVLGIGRNATKSDIIKGQVKAMKDKQFSPRNIALAQKQLSSPVQRLAVDFTYPQMQDLPAIPLETKIKSILFNIDNIDSDVFDSL